MSLASAGLDPSDVVAAADEIEKAQIKAARVKPAPKAAAAKMVARKPLPLKPGTKYSPRCAIAAIGFPPRCIGVAKISVAPRHTGQSKSRFPLWR